MAKKASTASVIYELAKPIANELGFTLWDVRFEKEGGSWFLRIILDKPGGVDMNDCEAMSRRLDPVLDEEDPVEQSYYLEVASAGLGRELRKPEHFEVCIGQKVELRLIRPLDGVRDFKGTLSEFSNGMITLALENGPKVFSQKDLSFIRLDDLDGEINSKDE